MVKKRPRRCCERLLAAEKNAQVTDELAAIPGMAAVPSSGGCGYVRQRQGRSKSAAPGTKCDRGRHDRSNCWAMLDDKWLLENPGKGPAYLPDRLAELRAKQGRGKPGQGRPRQARVVAPNDAHVVKGRSGAATCTI